MSQYNLYPDIVCKQQNCGRERICGDTFLMRRMAEGTLCVLSDGLGHGVKANVLSTLTASIIVNFDYHHQDIGSLAKLIIKSLPVCSVRKISYSTFTMLYFSHSDGKGTIIEFDNPQSFVFRDGRSLEPEWERMEVSVEGRKRPQVIMLARIDLRVGDRVVFMSDGVTQSGLGSDRYPFGWGRERVCAYIERVLSSHPDASSSYIATKVLGQSIRNDDYFTKDDISCGVATIRHTRRLLLCSCPPASAAKLPELASMIERFDGERIICGYHLAMSLSQLTGRPIDKDSYSEDSDLQPVWHMQGVDMITESLVTLNKVYDMLQNRESHMVTAGAAAEICNAIDSSDSIEMVLGTDRSTGGIYMVDEYELRRKVMRHIGRLLEQSGKSVIVRYL